ncbi:hypothetical protein Droror1_Dr00018311 [Drosera rotundifolia]
MKCLVPNRFFLSRLFIFSSQSKCLCLYVSISTNQNHEQESRSRFHAMVPINYMKPKTHGNLRSKRSPRLDHLTYKYVVPYNRMITQYVRAGDLDSALRVFDKMTARTTLTWNSSLAG